MKQISNKEYEKYQQYQNDRLHGRILTPDGLRVICAGLDNDPEKIGIHMLEMLAKFRNSLETVFFLLMLNNIHEYNIFVYYLVYSNTKASSAIMCRVSEEEMYFRFPTHPAKNLWDEEQWGKEYTKESIPGNHCSDRLSKMIEVLNIDVPLIQRIVNP